MKLIITFFDLIVQGLVLNLELLEIDQVKTISKLILLLNDLLLVCEAITKRDVLKTVLMNFLIFRRFVLFPIFDHFSLELLTSTGENSILGNCALEFLELLFNFLALSLLFIKLGLEFTSHAIVPVLGLFQVVTDLMYVSERVKILMGAK